MLMWVMSDRAIPRTYRMMQGFGVHTFRLVNAQGEARLCKFHWTPKLGTHALAWEEAVKISGADPDYHRRDLWEAIEAGAYPEYELGVQVFTEEDAARYSFDILDATKLVPEELVPVQPIGRMVLNRNPDNFFAETEQVAFCTAHVVPGIDFTNDPLLAGRIHSYVDTQIIAPRRPELPRDPDQRADSARAQQPARWHASTGDPSRSRRVRTQLASAAAVRSRRARRASSRSRETGEAGRAARPPGEVRRALQPGDAVLQQPDAGRAGAHRGRVPLRAEQGDGAGRACSACLRSCVNVSRDLAAQVADGLGMELPEPLPRAIARVPKPEVKASPALSMMARPGEPRRALAQVRDPRRRRRQRQDGGNRAARVARRRRGSALMGVRIGPCTTDAGDDARCRCVAGERTRLCCSTA